MIQNIIIWGCVSQNKLNPIQIQINKTLKFILNVKYNNFHKPLVHTKGMFKQLNLLKLSDIFEYIILKFIRSCFYGHNNVILEKHIVNQFPNYMHNTRNKKLNYIID